MLGLDPLVINKDTFKGNFDWGLLFRKNYWHKKEKNSQNYGIWLIKNWLTIYEDK
jgi:hypothetical protein